MSRVLAASIVFFSATSFAQLESATTSTSTKSVTKGSSDVSADSTATAAGKKEKKKTLNEVSFNLGGLFAAGNSRSAAVTAGVRTKIKRGDHQFTGAAQANYAQAAVPPAGSTSSVGQPTQTTVENVQALLRYDWFFAKHWSAFLQTSGWHDRFQGLDLRFQIGPGVAYYLVDEEKAQLWGEAGYDFQWDARSNSYIHNDDGTLKLDSDGNPLDKYAPIHNARLFVGFADKFFKGVEFAASAEYLQDLADGNTFRFVFDGSVKAALAKHFALATAVTVAFENNPLPNVENTDVITGVSLVYNMF
jgi:putative salt-induced outer membrane protein YdiY